MQYTAKMNHAVVVVKPENALENVGCTPRTNNKKHPSTPTMPVDILPKNHINTQQSKTPIAVKASWLNASLSGITKNTSKETKPKTKPSSCFLEICSLVVILSKLFSITAPPVEYMKIEMANLSPICSQPLCYITSFQFACYYFDIPGAAGAAGIPGTEGAAGAPGAPGIDGKAGSPPSRVAPHSGHSEAKVSTSTPQSGQGFVIAAGLKHIINLRI